MKRALPILCLLGAAGAWAFALFAPKEALLEPLPAEYVGTYDLVAFDPPKGGSTKNPLPIGKGYVFRFEANGTYAVSVMLNVGYEIVRREGTATVDKDGVMTLSTISTNRQEDRAPAERYRAEWVEDDKGRFLALKSVDHGYTFRLKKA